MSKSFLHWSLELPLHSLHTSFYHRLTSSCVYRVLRSKRFVRNDCTKQLAMPLLVTSCPIVWIGHRENERCMCERERNNGYDTATKWNGDALTVRRGVNNYSVRGGARLQWSVAINTNRTDGRDRRIWLTRYAVGLINDWAFKYERVWRFTAGGIVSAVLTWQLTVITTVPT